MPATFKVKLRKVANSLVISISKEIYEGMGWKEGDILTLEAGEKSIKVRK